MRLINRFDLIRYIYVFIGVFLCLLGILISVKFVAFLGVCVGVILLCLPKVNLYKCNFIDNFVYKLKLLTPGYLWKHLTVGDTLTFNQKIRNPEGNIIYKQMVVEIIDKYAFEVTLKYSGDDLRISDYPPIDLIKTVDRYTFIEKILPHWKGIESISWNDKKITL